jgi:hypothetical protein
MNSKRLFMAFAALFQIVGPSRGQEQAKQRQEISVGLHIEAEWRLLPPAAGTRSALRILRAVDPQTKKPYDNSIDIFGCNPTDLRRTFHLEKKDFILGEAILVEFRVDLHGPGQWQEATGGNYRSRGRDDNFLFLMRHKDGTWVQDRYSNASGFGGGLAGSYEVSQNKPMSYWFGVQRWCAIDKPGTYELYCFQTAHGATVTGQSSARRAASPDEIKKVHTVDNNGGLIDTKTGKLSQKYRPTTRWQRNKWPASPLADEIAAEVLAHAAQAWNAQSTVDFAHFTIVVREGTEQQRQDMIRYWTNIAESGSDRVMPTKRAAAAREGISFAQQDDFLPLIEKWIASASQPSNLYGLAMRPSAKAAAILLKTETPNAIAAMHYLHRDHIPDVIPQLIEWITHENDRMRTQSEYRLHTWTGQAFGRDFRGTKQGWPTMENAREIQPLWRKWWQQNKGSFKPQTQ